MKKNSNFLDYIPEIKPNLIWIKNKTDIIIVARENSGLHNIIARKLFNKPRVSYIELDRFGSFIWQQIDGQKNIYEIALDLRNEFGASTEPLFERIAEYFRILRRSGLTSFSTSQSTPQNIIS